MYGSSDTARVTVSKVHGQFLWNPLYEACLRISVSQVFSNLKLTAIPTECRGPTENHKGLCTGLHCLLRALKKKEKRREEDRSEQIFMWPQYSR
jgi:hypothetical protein